MNLSAILSGLAPHATAAGGWPLFVPRGRILGASSVLAALVLVGAGVQVVSTWSNKLPDNAVLRAGDNVVTQRQFQERVQVLEALYGVEVPKNETARDRFNRDAAKSVAVSLIIDRAAKDRHIVISDKQAQDALTKIIEEELPLRRDAFLHFLHKRDVSEGDVLMEIKRQLATSRLFQQITRGVDPVTDEKVRQAYSTRRDEMVTPEKRRLRNIVVESKQQATEVLEAARAGTPFTALVGRYSIDASTRDNGGMLGLLTADQLADDYAKAAFSAEEGAVFGPMKTRHGWNIGQVDVVVPPRSLTFQQVRGQLEQQLNEQRRLMVWRDWLAGLISGADVVYAEPYRPDKPAAPPVMSPIDGGR